MFFSHRITFAEKLYGVWKWRKRTCCFSFSPAHICLFEYSVHLAFVQFIRLKYAKKLIFYDIFFVLWQNIVRNIATNNPPTFLPSQKICYLFATKAILSFVFAKKRCTEHHIYTFEKNKIIYKHLRNVRIIYYINFYQIFNCYTILFNNII